MAKKGNGQSEMTDLMRQLLAEFVQVRQILREHGSALLEIRQDIRDLKGGMNQLNQHMAHIATFVGEDRARQNEKIDAIERRVETLERKAA